MYAMHLGWLNAPQDARDNKSRIEDFGKEHPICKLPDADWLVTEHFREVGPCLGVGMGAYAVTWQEIQSYSEMSCSSLTAWESRQIRMMSKLYCNYLIIGKKPCEPPYQREFDEDDIKAQNDSINKILEEEERRFTALKN